MVRTRAAAVKHRVARLTIIAIGGNSLLDPTLPLGIESQFEVAGAAVALINDLPAMLLAVSRLVFAWAEDGVFPKVLAVVHKQFHTPHRAIVASGVMASVGILGSHWAGDFFLGIDILVTSMLINFFLMCASVLALPRKNPELASRSTVLVGAVPRAIVGWGGMGFLALFLTVHTAKDLSADLDAWYFHSTWVWLIVMSLASAIYFREMRALKASGADVDELFSKLPPE